MDEEFIDYVDFYEDYVDFYEPPEKDD